jgi:hypothetical protein
MLGTEQQNIEITPDQVNKWFPMIGLPCYDRQLTEPFFMKFMQTIMWFKEIGLKFATTTISDSLISRARNNVVAKFMSNPQCTHLLFIDVDLTWTPTDIVKMLWHDKDIVCGSYPIKDINWKKVAKFAKEGVDPDELAKKSTRFVVNPVSTKDIDKTGKAKIKMDNGCMAVYDAGTGFMLIKREVFTKMFEAYPELKFNDDTGSIKDKERDNTYALFNSYVDPETKRFLSEDYGFCRYWQKIGGEIWIDPAIELTHLGRFQYEGSQMEYLLQMSKDQSDKDSE